MADSDKCTNILITIGKILVLMVSVPILFGIMMYGWLIIAFSTAHPTIPIICLIALFIALFLCCIGLFFHLRRLRRCTYALMLAAVLSCGAFYFWRWWTVYRFPVVNSTISWYHYRPWGDGKNLVEFEVPPEYNLDTNDLPRLDGAYALYPIYAAAVRQMYPWPIERRHVDTNGSDVIYNRLLDDDVDLIFALAPSKQQQQDADSKGLTYNMTPLCKDAFVFYVNAKNPVESLTTDQIKAIYSGAVTDWGEVGGVKGAKIIPFQRNEGSGSQTTLQKLMGDTPIMPPLKEDRVGGMGDIINDTANYRNYNAALGFSFRYYATELLRNNQIKLLSIDGVAPTVENICNNTYPLITTAYIVSVRPHSENSRKIVEFFQSPAGQSLVEKTGYVPITPTASTEI